MARTSLPVSSSPPKSKRLPAKRPGSSRRRTATAPMSATVTCASSLVRERRGVDALCELFFAEMEVLHEIDGRQDRGAHADLGDVLFDLVFAVEVRDACLSIGGPDRIEDEMYACGPGRV